MRVLDPNSPEVEAGVKLLSGSKVKFPEGPIDVELYFGYHGFSRHFDPALEASLRDADIFTLETVGWSQLGRDLRQGVAEGNPESAHELDYQTRSSSQAGFWQELHKALFDSDVMVHYADVPEGHGLVAEYKKATDEEVAMTGRVKQALAQSGQLPPAQELEDATCRLFSVFKKREEYILKHFFPKEIPEHDTLRVTGFFGLLHKSVAVMLANHAVAQGRDDVRVSVNEVQAPNLTNAYDDFLQHRPVASERILDYLTNKSD